MKILLFIILFLFTNFSSVFAMEKRFSGEPIPRFVSIKASNVNARVGPSVNYPIKYIYQSKLQPVQVVNEYYGWYQVEDINGDTSWIHNQYLSKSKYGIVLHDKTKLYQKGKLTSKVVAFIDKDVVFKIIKCSSGFCKVETNFHDTIFKGFIIQDNLWGVE